MVSSEEGLESGGSRRLIEHIGRLETDTRHLTDSNSAQLSGVVTQVKEELGNKLGQVTGVVQQVTTRVEEMMTVQARVQSLEQHQANLMALVESLVPLLGRVQTMEHQVTNVNQGIKKVMGDLRNVEGRLISQVEQAKEFMGHKINQDIGLLGEHLSKLEKLVIKHETGMGRGLGENVMRPPPGPSTTAMTLGQGGASQGCTLGTR